MLDSMEELIYHHLEAAAPATTRFDLEEGNPIIIGTAPGRTRKTVLFNNPYDVMPANSLDEWRSHCWILIHRSRFIIGLGVRDNKSNLVARLAAPNAIQSVPGKLPVAIKFLIAGQEEIATPHLWGFAEQPRELLDTDGCIWVTGGLDWQGKPELSLGCKGVISGDIEFIGAGHDAHSQLASLLANPTWQLFWALTTTKSVNEHILVPSLDDDGRPPSARDLDLADALPDNGAAVGASFGLAQLLSSRSGPNFERHLLFDPTVRIHHLSSGYEGTIGVTVQPRAARAKLVFRIVPDQRVDDLMARLRRRLMQQGFADATVLLPEAESASRSDPDAPFVKAGATTAEAIYGCPPKITPTKEATGLIAAVTDPLKIPITIACCRRPGSRPADRSRTFARRTFGWWFWTRSRVIAPNRCQKGAVTHGGGHGCRFVLLAYSERSAGRSH